MIINGMTPVSVADAMPTDLNTYLFLDSSGLAPAMYVDPEDREFALALGYDVWLRPRQVLDTLIPNKPIIEVDLTALINELESEKSHD